MRQQLEELAKRLDAMAEEWPEEHIFNDSAAAIRELLAQEPVGTISEENFTQQVMVGVNGWHTLPSPRSVPILFKVLPVGTPLYAAPVPAVDPEWKAEAMRLFHDGRSRPDDFEAWRKIGHAFAAHLDKLGGK